MGCQTPVTTTSLDSELMPFVDPVVVPWATWTPSDVSPLPPLFTDQWKAFDYAVLSGMDDVERTWSAVHGVLNLFQPSGTDALAMVMTELEPKPEEGLDITCVVSLEAPDREGLVFRWRALTARGLTPQVTVRMSRQAGESGPSEIVMWVSAGALEAEGETITLKRISGEWSMRHDARIGNFELEAAPGSEAKIVAELLTEHLWMPYQGPAYLERFGEPHDPKLGVAPVNAGLKLQDRDISQVMSDTVFPPRFQM